MQRAHAQSLDFTDFSRESLVGFGANPLVSDVRQCFTLLTNLKSIPIQSRLTRCDPRFLQLLRYLCAQAKIHLVGRLALKSKRGNVCIVLFDVDVTRFLTVETLSKVFQYN